MFLHSLLNILINPLSVFSGLSVTVDQEKKSEQRICPEAIFLMTNDCWLQSLLLTPARIDLLLGQLILLRRSVTR